MTGAQYLYDRREIGFGKPDPVLHAAGCPHAPQPEHAVGVHFQPHAGDVATAAAGFALRSHSCVPGPVSDLTLRCPTCGRRADMCFTHGDDWKKRRQ